MRRRLGYIEADPGAGSRKSRRPSFGSSRLEEVPSGVGRLVSGAAVAALQRTAGNRAVVELVQEHRPRGDRRSDRGWGQALVPSLGSADTAEVQRMHGGRPSRQERADAKKTKEQHEKLAKLQSSVDKKHRTRAGKALKDKLKDKSEQEKLQIALDAHRQDIPPHKLAVSGKKLFTGNRDFTPTFRQTFWNSHPGAVCAKCNAPIASKDRSIDHKRPWVELAAGVETFTVCKDGVHWDVALNEDAQAVNTNLDNLQPMHSKCNSSKNAPKVYDSLRPIKKGVCPGPTCGLEKAL